MAIGPAHYRFFDTVGPLGVHLEMERFQVVAETPKCWYIVPDSWAYLVDRGAAAKSHPKCKRVLKERGGRRYAYTDLTDAMNSYLARKCWQRRHAQAAIERAKAGEAHAIRVLAAGPVLPFERPELCPHGDYFREMPWGDY